MSDQFTAALDDAEAAHARYGEQLGLVEGRTPFAAESLPDARVTVRVNEGLIQKVASHILMRAGHILVVYDRVCNSIPNAWYPIHSRVVIVGVAVVMTARYTVSFIVAWFREAL